MHRERERKKWLNVLRLTESQVKRYQAISWEWCEKHFAIVFLLHVLSIDYTGKGIIDYDWVVSSSQSDSGIQKPNFSGQLWHKCSKMNVPTRQLYVSGILHTGAAPKSVFFINDWSGGNRQTLARRATCSLHLFKLVASSSVRSSLYTLWGKADSTSTDCGSKSGECTPITC